MTIGNNVTSIGSYIFSRCDNLISIVIPESVTSIGDYAFWGCSRLTTIPEDVALIGNDAFLGTAWYGNQPDGVVYAGDVLYDYKGIMPENTEIEVREGTVSITSSAFSGCSGLTSIIIPNSVNLIPERVFEECTGLERVVMHCSEIGNRCFYGNETIKKIVLGKGVTSVGEYAFSGCRNLTSITISESVTSIRNYAFDNCGSLKEILIEDGDEVLALGWDRTSVRRGEGLFYDCPLEKVYVGRNLSYEASRKYGYSPFYGNTKLNALTIGADVTEIGDYAFSGCNSLASITTCAVTPPACVSTSFEGVDTTIPVIVPDGSVADYQTAEVWKDFANFVGEDLTDIDNSEVMLQTSEDVIYDLRGRRVTHPEEGVYIVNGKKVIVK